MRHANSITEYDYGFELIKERSQLKSHNISNVYKSVVNPWFNSMDTKREIPWNNETYRKKLDIYYY